MAENVSRYPKPLDELGLKYLRVKNILPGTSTIKGILPNIVFWLEDEFYVENKDEVADALWLGLLYQGLLYTARDDLIDNDNDPNIDLLALSNLLMADVMDLHASIFPKRSMFWNILSNSMADCYRAEVWERTYDIFSITEFSDEFLLTLTKKHTGLNIPSLSAFPLLAEREDMIEPIVNMIKYYYIAHKLLDDLDDWQNDIKDRNFNFSSTILFFILRYHKTRKEQIKYGEIRLSMINSNFIEDILEIALHYLFLSLNCIKEINSPYLRMFLEGRIKSLQEKIQLAHGSRNKAIDQLLQIKNIFKHGLDYDPNI